MVAANAEVQISTLSILNLLKSNFPVTKHSYKACYPAIHYVGALMFYTGELMFQHVHQLSKIVFSSHCLSQ